MRAVVPRQLHFIGIPAVPRSMLTCGPTPVLGFPRNGLRLLPDSHGPYPAQSKLTQFLVKSCGYNPKKDIVFVPISGLYGTNIKDPVDPKVAPWYKGGTLFSVRRASSFLLDCWTARLSQPKPECACQVRVSLAAASSRCAARQSPAALLDCSISAKA